MKEAYAYAARDIVTVTVYLSVTSILKTNTECSIILMFKV